MKPGEMSMTPRHLQIPQMDMLLSHRDVLLDKELAFESAIGQIMDIVRRHATLYIDESSSRLAAKLRSTEDIGRLNEYVIEQLVVHVLRRTHLKINAIIEKDERGSLQRHEIAQLVGGELDMVFTDNPHKVEWRDTQLHSLLLDLRTRYLGSSYYQQLIEEGITIHPFTKDDISDVRDLYQERQLQEREALDLAMRQKVVTQQVFMKHFDNFELEDMTTGLKNATRSDADKMPIMVGTVFRSKYGQLLAMASSVVGMKNPQTFPDYEKTEHFGNLVSLLEKGISGGGMQYSGGNTLDKFMQSIRTRQTVQCNMFLSVKPSLGSLALAKLHEQIQEKNLLDGNALFLTYLKQLHYIYVDDELVIDNDEAQGGNPSSRAGIQKAGYGVAGAFATDVNLRDIGSGVRFNRNGVNLDVYPQWEHFSGNEKHVLEQSHKVAATIPPSWEEKKK